MNRNRSIAIGAIVLVIALIGIIFLKNQQSSGSEIRIGASLALTGEVSTFGIAVQRGVDIAVNEVNSNGGVDGKKLRVIYEDSKGDPATAVTVAQRLINLEGVKVIIGEIASTATLAIVPVAEQNKVFLFAPASSSPKLTGVSSYFARNWPSDVAEAGSAAEYAFNKAGAKTAAVIYVNSDYGTGLKLKFDKEYTNLGGTIVASEGYPFGTSDFRAIVLKVKQQSPQALYLAGNPKEMGILIKQIRELKVNSSIVSNTSFLEPDCLTSAGKSADDVVVPTPYFDPKDPKDSTAMRFSEKFEQLYGASPTMVNANAYDAIKMIADAIANVGYDGTRIAQYVRDIKGYKGAAGTVSFVDGEVQRQIVFMKIKDGKPERID